MSLAAAFLSFHYPNTHIHPNLGRDLLGSRLPKEALFGPIYRVAQELVEDLERNKFVRIKRAIHDQSCAEIIHLYSLGAMGNPEGDVTVTHSDTSLLRDLSRAWTRRTTHVSEAYIGKYKRLPEHAAMYAALCLTHAKTRSAAAERAMHSLLRMEGTWATRLYMCLLLSRYYLRMGRPREAVRTLAQCVQAYRGLEKFRRDVSVEEKPDPIDAYERYCAQALQLMKPPRALGSDVVSTVARVARSMPPYRRPRRPMRTLRAIETLLAAGESLDPKERSLRVADELATVADATVLYHEWQGRVLREQPQIEHTLATTTLRALSRLPHMSVRSIRPRSEFWRPHQRRPRAVLIVRMENEFLALAKHTRFRTNETRGVAAMVRMVQSQRRPKPNPQSTKPPKRERPTLTLGMIGNAPAWREVLRLVSRLAPTETSVVIQGETGTGKELVARALHLGSGRAQGPFVAVDCGALAGDMMRAELFGHVRGAFTGAHGARKGLIRSAHRGTLFLDEVGNMPADMQQTLLRVLQERSVRPVGGAKRFDVDMRLVCATHVGLYDAVEAGVFREDLFHRISVVDIDIPPLRARKEDIPLFVEHFLASIRRPTQVPSTCLGLLGSYDWPGNVRELKNVVCAAAMIGPDEGLDYDTLMTVMGPRLERIATTRVELGDLSPRERKLVQLLTKQWMSSADLARRLGVSPRTTNRDLQQLMELGWVKHIGNTHMRRYRATKTRAEE